MELASVCSSCGIGLVDRGYSVFSCPSCGEQEIGRCSECREHSTEYVCNKCNFNGP
ncbi:MAG: zinc finger domain-containing protein [Candidatus Thermoplasmatota archaeon]|nr:zinc finger domain-containing protein [Candidatus Thermoplasmatota archaeon]MCL5438306.1 zinc finger domain-containing protein [Candidatus Thermoplasmatota archaeon]